MKRKVDTKASKGRKLRCGGVEGGRGVGEGGGGRGVGEEEGRCGGGVKDICADLTPGEKGTLFNPPSLNERVFY